MSRTMECADPDRSPIFVIGTGRSGTTLLRMMLNAHPRIYVVHEAFLYSTKSHLTKDATGRQWLEYYFSTFPFKWLRLDPRPLVNRLPSDATVADAFRLVMRAQAERHGKSRFGDKTAFHCMYLNEIFHDFPDAKVIHLVRDPRDAVASLNRMPWAASSTALNCLFAEMHIRAVARCRNTVHEVKFEDLLADPKRVMKRILEYVGESWDDAVLDHQHHSPTDDVPPFPWFQSAKKNLDFKLGEPVYMKQFSGPWIREIERMCAFSMRRYGYTPAVLTREPSRMERARVRLQEASEIGRSLRRVLQFWKEVRKQPSDAEECMHLLLQLNPKAWSRYPGFEIPAIPEPQRDKAAQHA
jgi:hypothetical protein